MSHDIDIVDTEDRTVTLSFTAGGQGCWIFVDDAKWQGDDPHDPHSACIRLDGDSGEAVKVAQAILDFYKGDMR